MPRQVIRCSICGKKIAGSTFRSRMNKLRKHRQRYHKAAHARSITKAVRTKRARKAQRLVI